MAEPVGIAILAKAPIPGFAKTRLIPRLGAEGAADLQARLIGHAVTTALHGGTGPVSLHCAPDSHHPLFQQIGAARAVALHDQPRGDLGARMAHAFANLEAPLLLIGTDCPALDARLLRDCAQALDRDDAVLVPAEDGGYVLIGLAQPQPALFTGMTWGGDRVAAETRDRMRALGLSWSEPAILWDVDWPDDLDRLSRSGLLPQSA